jgi:DNA repair photolyase
MKIQTTDYIDAALDHSWYRWVEKRKGPSILITKDPKRLLTDFPRLLNEQVILHATITGYGGTFMEPNVPDPEEEVAFLRDIPDRKKIVIRIDPVVPLPPFIDRSVHVYTVMKEIGFERFRVSVMDLYPHVLKRFERYPLIAKELKDVYGWDMSHSGSDDRDYMHHVNFDLRRVILSRFPGVEVCGEPGFRGVGCASRRDLEILGIDPTGYERPESPQRRSCSCLDKKEAGHLSDPCPNGCLYCYKV